MQSPAAAIPFTDHDDEGDAAPTPATAWAYRRRARALRHRFRKNPAALHASLRTLVTEVDAAAPPRPARRSAVGTRQVRSHVVEPRRTRPSDRPPIAGHPASAGVGDGVRGVLQAPPEAVDRFATLVAAMLDEGLIRYSRRQALLRRADRLGIGRFEATLIIAAVEHRRRTYARPAETAPPPVTRRSVAALVAGVLLLEAAALTAIWTFV